MQQDLNNDKWYRMWWDWTPERVSHTKDYDPVIKRMAELARNRRIVGFYRWEFERFGRPTLPSGKDWDFVSKLDEKWERYKDTGNKEMLVDIFNYLIFEWRSPSHDTPHWETEDQGMEKCEGCNQQVDENTCWCGDDMNSHTDHTPVPMGCVCHIKYRKEN